MSKVCPSSKILPPLGDLAESVKVLFIQQPGLSRAFLGAEQFSRSPSLLGTLFRVGQKLVLPLPGLMLPSRICPAFCRFWPRRGVAAATAAPDTQLQGRCLENEL